MAKRVKKGFERSFSCEDGKRLVLRESKGLLGVECCGTDGHGHWFDMPVCDVEALGMTAVLEDVLEPWERLRDALRTAALEKTPDVDHPAHRIPSDVLIRAAELLGIKPEGES